MHHLETWNPAASVVEPSTRVHINGVEHEVQRVNLGKSMGDTLSGGAGLVATTGDITLRESAEDVFQNRATPWDRDAIRRGVPVTIRAGANGDTAPYFTGVVDGTSGGTAKDPVLEVVDRYAALDIEVTKDPLLASMPPFQDADPLVHVGLTPTHITSMLLRDCGFYATPAHRFGAVVNVPMNGSMLPEYGRTYRCWRIGNADEVPEFERAPWGQAVKNVTATYRPSSFNASTLPFEMRFLVGNAGTSGTVILAAYWGTHYLRVTVGSSRNVNFEINNGSGNVRVCSLTTGQMSGATIVTARIEPGGQWSLTTDTGVTASGSRTVPFSGMMTEAGVTVPANGAQIAGLQIGYMAASTTRFTPTADLGPAAFPHTLRAMPALVRRRVSDLLKEQARAELAAFWITDQGVLKWRNRYDLVAGSPVREVTSLQDLLELNWRESSATTTKNIKVSSKRPVVSVSKLATITLHEGRADSLESQQEVAVFMEPPNNEDWVMPDLSAEWLTAAAQRAPGFSRGRRTWIGMVRVNENADGDATDHWVSGSDQAVQKIDPRTFVITLIAPSFSGDQTVELRSHKSDGRIWEQRRNNPLPVLRGYGLVSWVEQFENRDGESGGLQEYAHDADWWIQHSTGLAGVANALEKRVLNPEPVLDDVPIKPDPRLELGDIITLTDDHVSGLSMRCLIEGIKFTAEKGGQEMLLTLRVLDVRKIQFTLEDLDGTWASYDMRRTMIRELLAEHAGPAPAWGWLAPAGPRLQIPTYEGSNQSVHPSVLYFPSGWNGYKYWMAETPYPWANEAYENPSIHASHDGTIWVDPPGLLNPIDEETGRPNPHNSDGHITMHPDGSMVLTWRMVDRPNGDRNRIFWSKSSDGVNWSPRKEIFTGQPGTRTATALAQSLIWMGNRWRMYFVLSVPNPNTLTYFESTTQNPGPDDWDGGTDCVINPGPSSERDWWHADIQRHGDEWLGVMQDVTRGTAGQDGNIYLLRSDDGHTWERSISTLVAQTSEGYDTIYKSGFVPRGTGDNLELDLFYSAYPRATREFHVRRTTARLASK